MYYNYYVNKQTQDNGDHEVHNLETCSRLPTTHNRGPLGSFALCNLAVEAAK